MHIGTGTKIETGSHTSRDTLTNRILETPDESVDPSGSSAGLSQTIGLDVELTMIRKNKHFMTDRH